MEFYFYAALEDAKNLTIIDRKDRSSIGIHQCRHIKKRESYSKRSKVHQGQILSLQYLSNFHILDIIL